MKTLLILFFFTTITLYGQITFGKNWMLINKDNSPLKSNTISKIFEDKEGCYWISSQITGYGGVLQKFCNGLWSTIDSTNSPFNKHYIMDINQTQDGKLIFATRNNGVFIKDGNIWINFNPINSPLPDTFVHCIAIDKQNQIWFGLPNYGIAVYNLNNGTWKLFNDNNSFMGIGDLNFIVVDKLNKVWVGTDLFGLYFYDGNKWTKVLKSLYPSPGSLQAITSMAVDNSNSKWITTINQGGIYKIGKSINDTTFIFYDSSNIGFKLPMPSYDGLVIDKKDFKYIGTNKGLIIFDNINWTKFDTSNSPVPGNLFEKGFVDSKNNKLFSISISGTPKTYYGFVFYNEDSLTVISNISENFLPVKFSLFQNYPNPFNSKTKIKFSVKDFDFTSLKVYDLLGREIAILLSDFKKPGEYEIEFDADKYNLSSGIYIYQLKSGFSVQSRKFVLIK
ncbi:MAG: T9SS type A sorting domain-containing protein [Ignavibacterium sp.]|nr:T9SS type A sorting domain-containing protein [Ignavibacterium sp.]